jgi:hypothetical protein
LLENENIKQPARCEPFLAKEMIIIGALLKISMGRVLLLGATCYYRGLKASTAPSSSIMYRR